MNVLAVDTSTSACVLGLKTENNLWVDETILGRSHSEELLPRIDGLLTRAEIDKASLQLIVYGQGPGSFTGLRIGVGAVQGLAFGLNVPVVGVSSLACLAQRAFREFGSEASMVALNARNTEVYFGAYCTEANHVVLQGRESVHEVTELPILDSTRSWVGVGSGWQFKEQMQASSGVNVAEVHDFEHPRALDLIDLGLAGYAAGTATAAEHAQPQYLREQVAAKPT